MPQKITYEKLLPDLIASHINEVRTLCTQHKLRYLYVVGSVLDPPEFTLQSDIDFVYAFDEADISDAAYNTNLQHFWFALEQLFNRKVDLIHGPSIRNPYFKASIDETKRLVYEQQKRKQIPVGHRR